MNTSRKLQLGLIVAAGTLLIAVTAERIASLRVVAEQLAFEHVVATLRAAVTVAVTRALVNGDDATLTQLDRGNPVELLSVRPSGYLGERDHGREANEGSWYFDARARELIYVPRFPEGFVASRGRLQLRVSFVDRNGDGAYLASQDQLRSAGLVVITGTDK